MVEKYHPEKYWNEVSTTIKKRKGNDLIAGDDEPYYVYKRQKLLQMFAALDIKGHSVLEIGPGPGGNLIEMLKKSPSKLEGVDISQNMIDLATKNTNNQVKIHKTDGSSFPYDDNTFDIVFSATVLQHNTDESMLKSLIKEMCRVSNSQVAIFEQVAKKLKGDSLCMARPVTYYEKIFNENGFNLVEVEYSNIYVSYLVCGAIRKVFNSKNRKEGEPLSSISVFLENLTLPVTKVLDKIFKAKRDLTRIVFQKSK